MTNARCTCCPTTTRRSRRSASRQRPLARAGNCRQLASRPEPRGKGASCSTSRLAILFGYAYFLLCFFSLPSRPGIDENAYLVAGRMIAEHGSPSPQPPHPLSFVGAMWVQSAKSGLFYPKYPAGSAALRDHPETLRPVRDDGVFPSYPGVRVGSAYATFLLARRVVSSFAAVLSMIVLAMGITTLELAMSRIRTWPACAL